MVWIYFFIISECFKFNWLKEEGFSFLKIKCDKLFIGL